MSQGASGGDEGSPGPAALARVLDEVIEAAGAEEKRGEVARAREIFEGRRGRVGEDEDLWESWTQAFLEWYAIEHVADGTAGPPAAEALARASAPRRAAALRSLLCSQRSLVQVRALRPRRVEVDDVLAGGAFWIAESRALHGVSVGDLAEVRLVGFEGEVHFGRTFCYHPPDAKAAILRRAGDIWARGGDHRDVLDACAAVRARTENYRHVEPARLYELAARRS